MTRRRDPEEDHHGHRALVLPSTGATIYSVAERAGVSIATVSRVLQGAGTVSSKTSQKVLDAVDALNYVPLGAARSLAVRHTRPTGSCCRSSPAPYYSELLIGFESRAAELGQSVTLMLTEGKGDIGRAVRQLATRVDAIAVLGSAAMPPAVARALHGQKPSSSSPARPGRHRGRRRRERRERRAADRARAGTRAHPPPLRRRPAGAPDIADRHVGFVAAHTGGGLVPAAPVRVAFREADGRAVAERLLSGELEADALVCANDELALAAMTRLQDAGRDVPGDVAVVGWDDVMTARYVRPGLTTVRQPVRELGAVAAERLHDRVAGGAPRLEPQVLATELVVRTSCGCPRP